MKLAILLSTLFPAGLCAAFLGSTVARQEDEPKAKVQETRRVQTVIAQPHVQAVAVPPAAAMPAEPRTFTLQTTAQEGRHGPVIAFARSGGGSDKTHKAMEKLRNADSDDEKSEAREELKTALSEEFDEYLEHQAKELEQMEKRLEKLRGQVEKRRDAKDELVSRRLQMLEDEADGLGWPGRGMGFGGFPGGGSWSYDFAPTRGASAAYGLSIPAPGVPGVPGVVAELDVVETDGEPIPPPDEAGESDDEDSEPRRPQPRPRRGAR